MQINSGYDYLDANIMIDKIDMWIKCVTNLPSSASRTLVNTVRIGERFEKKKCPFTSYIEIVKDLFDLR